MNFFLRNLTTPPSHFSKNVSVLSQPKQNPLLVCIVPKRLSPCLLLSSRRHMKVKLVPIGANFWGIRPLRVNFLFGCTGIILLKAFSSLTFAVKLGFKKVARTSGCVAKSNVPLIVQTIKCCPEEPVDTRLTLNHDASCVRQNPGVPPPLSVLSCPANF